MPRYYFNLVKKILDWEGVEVPEENLEQFVTKIIEELRYEDPELRAIGDGWFIEVVNGQGRQVARFPL
jgi:hypothetical protein